jgi:hypothetical protein
MIEDIIKEMQEYVDKKEMRYDVEFPSLEQFKIWIKDLEDIQDEPSYESGLEDGKREVADNVTDELEEFDSEFDELQDKLNDLKQRSKDFFKLMKVHL